MRIRFLRAVFGFIFFFSGITVSYATGTLQLNSSIVFIDTGDQEGTVGLRNESDTPLLLISKIEPTREAPEDLVMVNPPIARVEPGDTQIVRFMLKPRAEGQPEIKTERLLRVSFEGIPPQESNKLSFSIGQDIPVIIHPGNLPKANEPWKSLVWQRESDGLIVHNPTPYVIRFMPNLTLLPSKTSATLPGHYILPDQSLRVSAKSVPPTDTDVLLHPKTQYGFLTDDYKAPLNSAATTAPAK